MEKIKRVKRKPKIKVQKNRSVVNIINNEYKLSI